MLRAFKNFSIYTAVSVITGSISFLLLPVLTTYLSTEDYGLLSIFNASIRFCVVCIGLGMGHVMLVDLVQDKELFAIKLKSFVLVTLVLTALLFVVLVSYAFFSDEFFGLPIYIVIALPFIALLVVYYEFFTSIMVYLNQANKFAKYSLGKFGVETLLTILFIVTLGMNWLGRVLSLGLALAVVFLFLVRYLIRTFNLKAKSVELIEHARKLTKEGGALLFMSMSFMIINLSDRFFIEGMLGIKETGIYGVAATVAGVMFMIIGALMKVIRPKLYQLLSIKGAKKERLRMGIGFHFAIILFASILLLALPLIFEYFIDQKFNKSLDISKILIVGVAFFGAYNFFISYLLHDKKNKINSIIAITAMAINLLLNYVLINDYGIRGAAYATVITYVCMFALSFIFIFKRA